MQNFPLRTISSAKGETDRLADMATTGGVTALVDVGIDMTLLDVKNGLFLRHPLSRVDVTGFLQVLLNFPAEGQHARWRSFDNTTTIYPVIYSPGAGKYRELRSSSWNGHW